MKKSKELKRCQWCSNENLQWCDEYSDWDDVNDKEIIRAGYLCSDCGAFMYETDSSQILITPVTKGIIDFKEKSELGLLLKN